MANRPTGLWEALEKSAVATEILIARVDQGLSLGGIVIACAYATIRPYLAGSLISLCLLMYVVSTVSAFLMRKGRTEARHVLPFVEILLPGAAMVILCLVEGPGYALGSWVPPQLFFLFVSMNVIRLRLFLPLVMGILAAVQFWLIYGLLIYPSLVDTTNLLHLPQVQIVRGGSLIVIGGACSFAIYALKELIGRANVEVRATDLFGKYRLLDPVGTGGMGVVYEAMYCPEGGFERQVAVKLIHKHLAADQDLVARFREEAALSAVLTHPNLVGALDFGQVGDTYFFAMEFIDGPTFEQIRKHHRERQEPLDAAMIAQMGIETCQGLHYAHREVRDSDGRPLRVLHRDLSPMNLMLDRSGRVRILDFGVARALREAHSLHTTNLVGKPSYFSPEQLEDHQVDERSDLWSLAVVLWELLCGERLFRRRAEHATMLAVVESAVPMPTLARPELDLIWDSFFTRALDRAPERRYQSALQMGEALRDVARAHPPVDVSDMATLARLEDVELELEL